MLKGIGPDSGLKWGLISAQRVGFFNIGSGRVLDKIPGSGSDSGWVRVGSKYTIGYFWVSQIHSYVSDGIRH